MGGKLSKKNEEGYYSKSETKIIRKKVGEEVCISVYSNSSIGTHYEILKTNYKKYLTKKTFESEYLGKSGECGCYTDNSMDFICTKAGTAKIKLQWYFRHRKEGVETYKIIITK